MVTLAHFSFLLSDEDFYVLNTHYDDRGIKAREKSSSLILSKIAPLTSSGKLVVALGDLNSPADEEGYRVLTGHRYVTAELAVDAGLQAPLGKSVNTTNDKEGPTTFLDSRHALSLRPSLSSGGKKTRKMTLSATYGERNTYTGFSTWTRPTLIDYILLADNWALQGKRAGEDGWGVVKYGVLPNHFDQGVWVSDHRMVVVTLRKV
ncbi:hypothetical protein HWV62_34183 [Athelia sp. TMB]|nr:hypothetical protein HWV62_34183 [Athelia sp. TMB]